MVTPTAIVAGIASDPEAWHLVRPQLILEDLSFAVTNLGPGVPDELLLWECRVRRPDLVVLSGVNGRSRAEGLRAARWLRTQLPTSAVVVIDDDTVIPELGGLS
jgi:methylaspartate mutase sigma subunit